MSLTTWTVTLRSNGTGSLGFDVDDATNSITRIDADGTLEAINTISAGSVELGDVIVAVNGANVTPVGMAKEKILAWKRNQTQGMAWPGSSPVASLRLTLYRPSNAPEPAAALPEPAAASEPAEAEPVPEFQKLEQESPDRGSVSTVYQSDEQSVASTVSAEPTPFPDAGSGERPSQVVKPVELSKVVDSQVVADPPRRWYEIFQWQCCAPAGTDEAEVKRILNVVTDGSA